MRSIMRSIMNLVTYVMLICFNTSVLLVMWLLKCELYDRIIEMKEIPSPIFINVILIGGFVFVVFVGLELTYSWYKKNIYLNK